MSKAKIGLIGLGVMGTSLALNIERNGFPIAVFNRSIDKMTAFVNGPASGKKVYGAKTVEELIQMLEKPRRIIMMVQAGAPVDSTIELVKPFLEKGDILIDAGNSFFVDTERRSDYLAKEGLNFFGMGVSGGEEGALWGPSIMPGGQKDCWEALRPILKAIAAKYTDGEPCVEYIGPRGSGHYVKMVHNGIEYGDMQLIAETYDLLHRGLGLNQDELHAVFAKWNEGVLKSYLIEITGHILTKFDPETGKPMVDIILDEAQQKGTGKWTAQNALDIGAPIPTLNSGVEGRILSSLKNERVAASKILTGPDPKYSGDRETLIAAAENTLYCAKIASYAQGLGLLKIASKEYGYDLNLAEIAKIWRAGCIIRADFLNDITSAYEKNPDLQNLMLDDFFRKAIEIRQDDWRKVVKTAVDLGIPMLATSSALAYYDSYRSAVLPANMTQAQRDFFGAHTYRRIDKEGSFHTIWE
ncbi:MAG: NADP-dependent phosphogluconate dehydrogenase [Flexilinea sp.]